MTVAVASDDFDTVLEIVSVDEVVATNDDFDGTNSQLTVQLPRGLYGVFVTSYGAGQTGAYRIRAEMGSGGSVREGRLEPGPTLADGTYYSDFQMNGRAGDCTSMTMV